MPSLKAEMLKQRMASQYDLYFESDLREVLFHFATVDGAARPAAGTVCLVVLQAFHPKQWHGFTGASVADVINSLVLQTSTDYRSLKEPFLMRVAREADGKNGTQLADRLGAFLYELARAGSIRGRAVISPKAGGVG